MFLPEGLLVPAALVAIASFLLCATARAIAPVFGLMDHPDVRKHHATPTPLMGGGVVLCVLLPAFAYVALVAPTSWPEAVGITVAVGCMTLLGLFDDMFDQPAVYRLVVASVVFVAITWFFPGLRLPIVELQQPDITFVLDRAWVAVGFTSICCVGLVNAINMADGKNGLVPGLMLGWSLLLLFCAPVQLAGLLLLLVIAIAALFLFNVRGFLFLGDGGAYGLATAIGLLAIAVYNHPANPSPKAVPADVILLLFMVPVLDLFRLMVTRTMAGKTPFTPGRDHLHHYLQNWLGWPGGLLAYWCLSLAPASLKIIYQSNSIVLMIVAVSIYVIIIWRVPRGASIVVQNP